MSKKHTNFPIYPYNHNDYIKEFEDFFTYLVKNPQHKLRPKYYRKGYFSTEHTFEDGLLINQVWKLHVEDYSYIHEEVGRVNSIEDLIVLTNKNLIELIHADIWSYSQNRSDNPSEQEIKEFRREVLEYQVKEPSKVPDSLFDVLTSEVNNYLLFEKYLTENKG